MQTPLQTFFQALWRQPDREGEVTFWFAPSKVSLHIPVRSIAQLGDDDQDELAAIAGEEHVYFGLGLRRPGLRPEQQGGKKDVIALPGFALDIDFYDPKAHKATNLPRDLDEASVILKGYPDPTVLNHTGNGAHSYWLFDNPVELSNDHQRKQLAAAYSAFQAPAIAAAKERGWQLDSTSTIQRVWRVPGFNNPKTDKPVEILFLDLDNLYAPGDLGVASSVSVAVVDDVVAEDEQADDYVLTRVRSALARIGPNNQWHENIQSLLRGESFAAPGERDITMQGVASTIAWLPEGRGVEPERLAEIFRPGFVRWVAEAGANKTLDEELAKAADKIRRSQEDYDDKQAAKRPQFAALAKAMGLDLEGGPGNEFFIQRAIIQRRTNFYVFDFVRGRYSHPLVDKEIRPFVRDAWLDGPDDLSLTYANDKGVTKTKTVPRLLDEYSTVADDAVGDLTRRQSYYDWSERVFHEAMAVPRVTEARFDKWIDTWLRLLAGPNYEEVCNWIASIPQLKFQNSALYLDGSPGTGKGLFARGHARIWRKGPPTDLANILGSFNTDIVQCPLLWIDENLPHRIGDVSGEIRALVGSSSFTLNEKYMAPRTVNGAIRLLICANNETVLMRGAENLSVNDLEAYVGRFLYVPVQRSAKTWLEKNNVGGHLTDEWIDGDAMAMHCLHLAQTRDWQKGKRFLVEGHETPMHRRLVMQGETNGLIYEWLVRFASNPDQVYLRYKARSSPPLAIIGREQILVNTQGVIDCWDVYMKNDLRPKTGRTGSVLTRLSHQKRRLGPRGKRSWYHQVKLDLVLEWAQQNQVGNEDAIIENYNNQIEIEGIRWDKV